MAEETNNGTEVKKHTGCWNCKYLEYVPDTSYETQDGGYDCNKRDIGHFKDFPCKRKLKCFELNQLNEDNN